MARGAEVSVMIEFVNVSKTYRAITGRTVTAVNDFSLQVAEGEVLGIAGPNGAGKSTLIGLLLGYVRPTAGQVHIAGCAPRHYIARQGIGYLPELVHITPTWRTVEALTRYALLAGVPSGAVTNRVETVIEQLGLTSHRTKRIKALSKGTLQRLGFAQALLCDYRVLVLDEPSHGLDPVWIQRFRDMVLALRQPDRIILIASHNLDELQRLATRVAILDSGRLQRVVATTSMSDDVTNLVYRLHVTAGAEHVPEIFTNAIDLGHGEFTLSVTGSSELNQGLGTLLTRGVRLVSVVPAHSWLETQFHETVGGATEGAG